MYDPDEEAATMYEGEEEEEEAEDEINPGKNSEQKSLRRKISFLMISSFHSRADDLIRINI